MTLKEIQALSDDELRTRVAELCGYVLDPIYASAVDPIWDNGMERCHADQLPDYPNDLNAMHEAEKVIAPFYTGVRPNDTDYDKNLRITMLPTADTPVRVPTFKATAHQRAEAFVLTMEGA